MTSVRSPPTNAGVHTCVFHQMIYMHIFFLDDQSERNVAMHAYLPTTVPLQYHSVKGRFASPHGLADRGISATVSFAPKHWGV